MPQQGLPGKARQGLALTLIALQVWQPVLAGVVATTPGVSQDQAANGVPIVNIAAPGTAGISHNTYTRFDVDKAGLILNNSAQPANTQLGGYIPGNANLAHGSARLILNEVSGKLPSQLNGYMEIAGQKAEMVIANPAGITCNGCGFINTSRSTLSTGKPLLGSDGSLSGFRVEDGELRFEGLGLNASNTERLNLYSRALVLNAELHARELDVVTGANHINAGTGTGTATALSPPTPAPAFAIDSSSLGGMYANRITLVGTEAGVGMRLAGPVAALTGNLEITSTGDVRLVRASSAQDLSISSSGQLALNGLTTAGGDLAATAQTLALGAAGQVHAGAIALQADMISTDSHSAVAARSNLALSTSTLDHAGALAAGNTLNIASQSVHNSGALAGKNGVTVTAVSLHNSGRIEGASGDMRVAVSGALDNRRGTIHHSGETLSISGGTLDNQYGEIISNGQARLSTVSLLQNAAGLLQGNQGLTLEAQGLDNTAGALHSNGDITLTLNNGALLNTQGLIETTGSLQVSAQGGLSNQDGAVRAGQNLQLALPDFDSARSGGVLAAAGELHLLTQGDMRFSGNVFTTPGSLRLEAGTHGILIENRVEAGGAASLQAGLITVAPEGWLLTQGMLHTDSHDLNNHGVIFGRDGVTLQVDHTLNNDGVNVVPAGGGESTWRSAAILSAGDIRIETGTQGRLAVLNNIGSQIESRGGNIVLQAEQLNNLNEGWSVAPAWQENLPTVYADACNKYCNGLDHIWNQMFNRAGEFLCCYVAGASNPAPILFESSFYDRAGQIYQNVWLFRTQQTITHQGIASSGTRAAITANTAPDGSGGDIRIEAGTLDNARSSISAAALLDITAEVITNTATVVHDRYVQMLDSRKKSCDSDGDCDRKIGAQIRSEGDYAARPEQIISSVLEGRDVALHGTAVLWNGDGEEGTVARGSTVVAAEGAWGLLSATPPESLVLATKAPLALLDPTLRPGFTLPNNGLFQRTPPGHPYLIETDPALNTYEGFLGSGYLLAHLDWSPDITQRRLGDSYYELMLVREVLLASLGSRFVAASIADERQQFEYLAQNAIAAAEALHLSPGIALSRAQIDALQQDIVWLEERHIMGERVLVPVVYLAQGSARVLSDGAVISGGSVQIGSERFSNSGLVRARDNIDVKVTEQLDNLGGSIISAGDLRLQSGGDIFNESGHISGENVLLQAAGDITHRTWSAQDSLGTAANGSWATQVGDIASVSASGQMTQIAGGDIRLVAARLDGNSVALAAGNNIILDTVQLDQGYRRSGSRLQEMEEHTRHLQTQVTAALDLSLSAGNAITAIAADLSAGRDASLVAGNSIALLAVEDTDHAEQHAQKSGSFKDKSSDLVHSESRLLGTQLHADGNVSLTTHAGDITLYASSVSAGGQADVSAGGNLNLIAGVNTVSHSEQENETTSATFKKHSEGYITQTAAGSGISSKGDLTLTAGKDINLVASGLMSESTLRIGETTVAEGQLSAERDAKDQLPLNLNVTTLELTNESWNETKKGFSGVFEELAKITAMGLQGLKYVGYDVPEIEIGSHEKTRSKDVLQAGSGVYARDLSITVQDTARFIGADIGVQGTAAVTANNIIIDAAAETHSTTHNEGSDTVKGLGVKLNDDEVRVAGVQETKTSVSDTQSVTEWRGTSISAGQLILSAEKNIEILGSQLNVVGDAIIEAGGELTIAGREGSVTQEHKETTEVITVAAAVRNAYVDAALAVKGVATATDALKDAKKALDEAERKVGLGQLDASDLDYFRINVEAAKLNLAQATIAAAASLASAALIASSTAGTGFYASGSAMRDKTTTTSTSTQTVWQGSELNVGGSALLAAGDTLKVQGSDVAVTNTLVLDANKIELIAGEERSTQKSKTTEEHEGASVSFSPASVSGSVNASQRDTDADSSSLHYVNSHISAGALSSKSDSLRVAGVQVLAGDIAIETSKLVVASLQDESHSKSQTRGVSAGVGIGSGSKPSSVSAGMEKSDSSASSLWVSEQTQIIGSNSIKIRAKDTTITGAVIANATYDENGDVQGCTSAAGAGCARAAQLIDQGNLDFQTDTLVVNDLHDYNKSKTTGFNVSVTVSAKQTLKDPNDPTGKTPMLDANGQPRTYHPGSTTVGGQYYGHETQQVTHATLGGGNIVVGEKTLDENSATELGLATLNRDLNKAQEITVDKDIGGLNASVTVDNRLFTENGRASIGEDFSNAGKNWQIVSNGLEKDVQMISVNVVPDVMADALLTADKFSLGLLPFDSADHGGLLAEIPVMLGSQDIFQRQYLVVDAGSAAAQANPESFMPASELPGYKDLAPEGQKSLEGKLVSRESIPITTATATFQNTINGMFNTEAEAVVNGFEQTGSDVFTLNYNPRHGFLADLLEIGTDKMGIAVTQMLQPVASYTGVNLTFMSGMAQGTGEFMQQVMQARGDAGANFAPHSQGNILLQAGLLGVSLEGVDLTHVEIVNGVDKEFPNFSVSSYGSPVNNVDMNRTLRDKGMLYSTSVANDGDFVAKFLGGNTGTYRASDPTHGDIEKTVAPFFSKERWTQGGNPFALVFGEKYEEKDANGNVRNWVSPHSSYTCTGRCGNTAPWEKKQ